MAQKEDAKKNVAKAFLEEINLTGSVGFGTGSTVNEVINELTRSNQKNQLSALSTSEKTSKLLQVIGITETSNFSNIDLSFDGADWVDKDGNCIKGYGGALTREKIVCELSKEYYILIDESKLTDTFAGKKIPIEIIPKSLNLVLANLEKAEGKGALRMNLDEDQKPFITDNGNFIVDCIFKEISDLQKLAFSIKNLTGVVEHGLFLSEISKLFVAYFDGTIKIFDNGKRV